MRRLGVARERPSELEDIAMETVTETPKTEKRREQKTGKAERTIRGPRDTYERCDTHTMGVPEGEEGEKKLGKCLKPY